jgi:two-component system LytT family response regulator
MKSIKAVLIDDVEVMRITLKKVLEQFPHINIIGEASSFDEAKEVVNRLKPDLLFLDIDLNGLISIDLLEELNCTPKIIFITSHENFAIKAFEMNAIDFIIKPISAKRIANAIERVSLPSVAVNDNNLNEGEERFQSDQIILLNFDNKMNFIKIKDINYIEAYGNYTKINMLDGKLSITYNSIKNCENKLPLDIFIQIHRSTVVNLINVLKIEKWTNDTGRLYLKNVDKPFEISRSYFFQIKKKYKM